MHKLWWSAPTTACALADNIGTVETFHLSANAQAVVVGTHGVDKVDGFRETRAVVFRYDEAVHQDFIERGLPVENRNGEHIEVSLSRDGTLMAVGSQYRQEEPTVNLYSLRREVWKPQMGARGRGLGPKMALGLSTLAIGSRGTITIIMHDGKGRIEGDPQTIRLNSGSSIPLVSSSSDGTVIAAAWQHHVSIMKKGNGSVWRETAVWTEPTETPIKSMSLSTDGTTLVVGVVGDSQNDGGRDGPDEETAPDPDQEAGSSEPTSRRYAAIFSL